MATLSVSTPSAGVIAGRSGVPERELDTGTTTMSSSVTPPMSSSADRITAGRCLPGSPERPAPKLTNHSSPRFGSVNSVPGRVAPILGLVAGGDIAGLGLFGITFSLEDRVPISLGREVGQQC